MFLFLSLSSSYRTPSEAYKNGAQCRICKRARELAKRDTMSTFGELKKYISKKCEALPNSTRGLCEIISSDWLEYIRDAKTDEEACVFACKNVKGKAEIAGKPRTAKHMEPLGLLPCDACVTIVDISMTLAPDYLGNFDVNHFRTACTQIEMFADRCHLFTDEVFANVVQYVLANLSPYELCVQYGMC